MSGKSVLLAALFVGYVAGYCVTRQFAISQRKRTHSEGIYLVTCPTTPSGWWAESTARVCFIPLLWADQRLTGLSLGKEPLNELDLP